MTAHLDTGRMKLLDAPNKGRQYDVIRGHYIDPSIDNKCSEIDRDTTEMSADPRGFYRILGVDPSSSHEEIEKAYQDLFKSLNPTLNEGKDTNQAFKSVTVAYIALSDPSQRAAYDQTGPVVQKVVPVPSVRQANLPPISPITPYTCNDCGIISPELRHIKVRLVCSFILVTFTNNIQGTFCEACATERMARISTATCMFGWWSPYGLFLTGHALAENGRAGEQPLMNLEICTHQALYYSKLGDYPNARIAARDAKIFAFTVKKKGILADQHRAEQQIKVLSQLDAEPCMSLT